ncbi:LuxR C-terminal-related transcriptional regulator [Paraburkholderia megapolitana]|uniref:LuxR family transcriptional regulator, maltose regulon positive regulatory protein n=1 Tax=Paraburkholderia megapolitana TaxID=420953 RepID=A0A1I3N6C4_9BURK|nr:LuxR C-terminal-related transcriptional regulator [Paraburkholderia megapolitana]SFJ04752.1 LuxR family transcriptional regulator, maltose regulon positive regulatory protein [Paraburkholderia megapolitana]
MTWMGNGSQGQPERPEHLMHVIEATPPKRPPLFLATKVFPPRLPPGLIDRPRLLSLAGKAEYKRLTVIKAPAGFGKTSLALMWLNELNAGGAFVAWLSLDTEDDEPARFFHHLAQALRNVCASVGPSAVSLTTEASLVPAHLVVSTLVNELVEVDDEVYLFIDDYHVITLPAIHDAMSYFIANVSSNVHVVICTRADPPLPLANLRARNELLEIDASTLRFNIDETRSFVEHECPGELRPASVKSLFASTEGWAAALRISASVLARGEGKTDWGASAPSGASRPFAAYLEEMLKRLPADMVEFMLCTSILDRLSASLCEAVTGIATERDMLETISARQLLLEPIDVEGHWFRYHHLMGEYLRQRLETQQRGKVAVLHRRASEWYAKEALWTDAVKHSIAAGDTEDAVALMSHCAMALVTKGDLLTLLGWQRQFPAHLMRGQVKIKLAIAWGMALAMRFDEARAMLDEIEHDAGSHSGDALDNIHWECQAIRSVAIALQDDAPRALAIAQTCLERPSTDSWTTNVVSNVVRFGHWKAGNLQALYATPWIPYSIEEDQRNVFASVYRLCLLGHAEMQQMHFALAERYFTESMQLAERHTGPKSISVALCAPMIAQIWYEQGRLDEAEALLLDLMPVIDLAVLLDSTLIAYRVLIRIAIARADTERAYTLLDQAQILAYARGWDRMIAGVLVERARLYLDEGRMTEASACIVQMNQLVRSHSNAGQAVSPEIETYRAIAMAWVSMARNDTGEALASLEAALQSVEDRHGDYLALRLRTVLALVWLRSNEPTRAVEIFREVLSANSDIYRSIIDQGPEIGPLLRAVRDDTRSTPQTKESTAYIDRLLDGWRALYEPAVPRRDMEREPLSARERGIVELIAQGQSNKEIARTLGIAPETVKTHVKNIFVKLDVDKRAHAVSRAQTLGLVAAG